MSQKLLIILLVVLALIFLITVGMGGCHHGGRSPNNAGFVGALKGLQGNRFLQIGDKAFVEDTRTCSVGAQSLTVNPTCLVIFQKRAFFRKSTRVALRPTNRTLHVVIEPRDGPRQEETVGPGDCFGSAVSHSGGAMTLTAPAGAVAVLLTPEPCPER